MILPQQSHPPFAYDGGRRRFSVSIRSPWCQRGLSPLSSSFVYLSRRVFFSSLSGRHIKGSHFKRYIFIKGRLLEKRDDDEARNCLVLRFLSFIPISSLMDLSGRCAFHSVFLFYFLLTQRLMNHGVGSSGKHFIMRQPKNDEKLTWDAVISPPFFPTGPGSSCKKKEEVD